mmetsp:Transcript_55421/g.89807  ORF Transcript_55421/g.89807 Transcript_55421/m.89807 type:complete len:219 (-) Transcript_55421:538-1194(-)
MVSIVSHHSLGTVRRNGHPRGYVEAGAARCPVPGALSARARECADPPRHHVDETDLVVATLSHHSLAPVGRHCHAIGVVELSATGRTILEAHNARARERADRSRHHVDNADLVVSSVGHHCFTTVRRHGHVIRVSEAGAACHPVLGSIAPRARKRADRPRHHVDKADVAVLKVGHHGLGPVGHYGHSCRFVEAGKYPVPGAYSARARKSTDPPCYHID